MKKEKLAQFTEIEKQTKKVHFGPNVYLGVYEGTQNLR